MKNNTVTNKFCEQFRRVQKSAYKVNFDNGWWKEKRNPGESIALIHSELSEGLEALRHNIQQSDHIPEFTGIEEEFADVIIRIMDFAEDAKMRLAEAIIAKIEFNKSRGYRHGGKKL